MNITAWASKDGEDRNASSLLKTDKQDQLNTTVTETRAAAWEDAEKAKYLARFSFALLINLTSSLIFFFVMLYG
ncbi:hypothetical protein H5410_000504 [Solanum commersonii]|uniref:Uncharacterized protein n=1 Tax=Solanum commersonii TaxID=4109 RepID=A0A9J6AX36_SOLCO|nr:hypothetical protein H5410_000504 [Solanum commersonii]